MNGFSSSTQQPQHSGSTAMPPASSRDAGGTSFSNYNNRSNNSSNIPTGSGSNALYDQEMHAGAYLDDIQQFHQSTGFDWVNLNPLNDFPNSVALLDGSFPFTSSDYDFGQGVDLSSDVSYGLKDNSIVQPWLSTMPSPPAQTPTFSPALLRTGATPQATPAPAKTQTKVQLDAFHQTVSEPSSVEEKLRAEQIFLIEREWSELLKEQSGQFACMLTPAGMYLRASENAKDLVGYRPDQLIGKNITAFIHVDDLPVFYDHLTVAMSHGRKVSMSYRFKVGLNYMKMEGTFYSCLTKLTGETSCIFSYSQPVVHAKIEAGSITVSRRKFMSRHTLDGVFSYASPSIEAILGWTPQELDGKSAYEFFHTEDLQKISIMHSQLKKTSESTTIRYKMRCKSGSYVLVETNFSIFKNPVSGKSECIICTSSEVDDPSRATNDDGNLVEKLQFELDELKKLLNTRTVEIESLRTEQRRLLSTNVGTPQPNSTQNGPNSTSSNSSFSSTGSSVKQPAPVYSSQPKQEEDTTPFLGPKVPFEKQVSQNPLEQIKKKPRRRKQRTDLICQECGTNESPEWRKGPTGNQSLCNACGLRFAKKRKSSKSDDANGYDNTLGMQCESTGSSPEDSSSANP